MRYIRVIFISIEGFLIGLMSFCSMLAFCGSHTYFLLKDTVSANHPYVASFLPLIIGEILFLIGIILVVIRGKGLGIFTWLTVLFSLPSFFGYNSINIFKIIGLEWQVSTQSSFGELLFLGLALISGYILLYNMTVLQQNRRNLLKRGVESFEAENVYTGNHLFLFSSMAAVLIIVFIIGIIAIGIDYLSLSLLEKAPLSVMFSGLGCIVIIAVYLYWLSSRHNPVH